MGFIKGQFVVGVVVRRIFAARISVRGLVFASEADRSLSDLLPLGRDSAEAACCPADGPAGRDRP
jgi:hypothetical protein